MTYVSVDVINANNTKSCYHANGKIVWTNEATNAILTSNGEVLNEKLKKIKPTKSGCYYVKITDGISTGTASLSFNTLFSRMVLGKKLGSQTIRLKDKTKGYAEDNIEFVKLRTAKVISKPNKDAEKQQKQRSTQEALYSVKSGSFTYVTEDFGEFISLDSAEKHQDKVTEGKKMAQIVLDYNGDVELAQAIYNQTMQYTQKQPYKQFMDIMNNSTGVTVVTSQYAVFERVYENPKFFNIKRGIVKYICGRKFSLKDAEAISNTISKLWDLKKEVNSVEEELDKLIEV